MWSRGPAIHPDVSVLRAVVIAAGLGWSVVFVMAGLYGQLQMYADGSIFSYAVAVREAWTYHWHNISGRLFVYLFCYLPAESYVALTGDARGGIVVYGFLLFVAPLLGLVATFAADRSKQRIIFSYACGSTACVCPLVFGFPTEMWMAHALFWPALALCHDARGGIVGLALVFATLLALVLTHGGGVIFAIAILCTLLLRGVRDAALLRATGAFFVVMAIWTVVEVAFPPDDYFGRIVLTAALNFIDVTRLATPLLLLLLLALASYGIGLLALRTLWPARAHVCAAAMVAVALAAYWLWFDRALNADDRYILRTVLLIVTPVLGALAAAYALRAEDRLNLPVPLLPWLLGALSNGVITRALPGAIALVMLVHAVETAKFVTAWTAYKSAVRTLAMGTASDPALGDPRFVSSARIEAGLNRLAWSSTTHFLSVLLAPNFAPARLVLDPGDNYVWLSCATATASEQADRVIPKESRRLVRVHACLHR